MNECRCPCVVRLTLFSDKSYVYKYIRLSCGGKLFVHDRNEVLRYRKSIIDDEISESCGVSGNYCVDCIAICEDRLAVIEFTNEEGLEKHIINKNQICKINKKICENKCMGESSKSLSEILVLLGVSDPTLINYILKDRVKCLRNGYEFKVADDLKSFCNYICNAETHRLNILFVTI
jgi:hypothetical protein